MNIPKTIAVVCKDVNDFEAFIMSSPKTLNNPQRKKGEPVDGTNGDIYIMVNCVDHLNGMSIADVVRTDLSYGMMKICDIMHEANWQISLLER